jgi:hypothetical protein
LSSELIRMQPTAITGTSNVLVPNLMVLISVFILLHGSSTLFGLTGIP